MSLGPPDSKGLALSMTTFLTIYFTIGLLVTVIGLSQLYLQDPNKEKLFLKVLLGALFWPLALTAYWYSRQQEVWTAGTLSPTRWLKEKEAGGRYQLTKRIELIVRYQPRKKYVWHGHLVLERPRFTLDAPFLIAQDRYIITTIFSQYHIYKEKRHAKQPEPERLHTH